MLEDESLQPPPPTALVSQRPSALSQELDDINRHFDSEPRLATPAASSSRGPHASSQPGFHQESESDESHEILFSDPKGLTRHPSHAQTRPVDEGLRVAGGEVLAVEEGRVQQLSKAPEESPEADSHAQEIHPKRRSPTWNTDLPTAPQPVPSDDDHVSTPEDVDELESQPSLPEPKKATLGAEDEEDGDRVETPPRSPTPPPRTRTIPARAPPSTHTPNAHTPANAEGSPMRPLTDHAPPAPPGLPGLSPTRLAFISPTKHAAHITPKKKSAPFGYGRSAVQSPSKHMVTAAMTRNESSSLFRPRHPSRTRVDSRPDSDSDDDFAKGMDKPPPARPYDRLSSMLATKRQVVNEDTQDSESPATEASTRSSQLNPPPAGPTPSDDQAPYPPSTPPMLPSQLERTYVSPLGMKTPDKSFQPPNDTYISPGAASERTGPFTPFQLPNDTYVSPKSHQQPTPNKTYQPPNDTYISPRTASNTSAPLRSFRPPNDTYISPRAASDTTAPLRSYQPPNDTYISPKQVNQPSDTYISPHAASDKAVPFKTFQPPGDTYVSPREASDNAVPSDIVMPDPPSSPLEGRQRRTPVDAEPSDTQLNGHGSQEDSSSPIRKGFAELASSRDASEEPGNLFSESLMSNHDGVSQRTEESATQLDFAATQVQVATPPVPPRSTVTSRTNSTRLVPESRMLRRRPTTTVSSNGSAQVVFPKADSPPLGVETYVDPPIHPKASDLAPILSGSVAEGEPPGMGFTTVSVAVGSRHDWGSSQNEPNSETSAAPAVLLDPKEAGMHEIEEETLERAGPSRRVTKHGLSPKTYGKSPAKRTKITRQPSSSPPPSSSSSSSDADDPADHTFETPETVPDVPFGGVVEESFLAVASKPVPTKPTKVTKLGASAPKPKKVAKLRTTGKAAPSSTPTTRSTRADRGKRKAMSPSPELSGPSSGSAPEDNEDFSYHPSKKVAVKKQTPEAPAPAAKKAKKNPAPRSAAKRGVSAARAKSTPKSPAPSIRRTRSHSLQSVADVSVASEASSSNTGPLRVLAVWSKLDEWYAGTVTDRTVTGYRVRFDDGHTAVVPADQLRYLRLKVGEVVGDVPQPLEFFTVAADWDGAGDIQVLRSRSSATKVIPSKKVIVLPAEITSHFEDRVIPVHHLEMRFPLPVRAQSMSRPGKVFDSVIFFITTSSKNDGQASKDLLKKQIEKNGGTFEDTWEALFDIGDDRPPLLTARYPPFLISGDHPIVTTPKLLAALSNDIPIISPSYIQDAIDDPTTDWRSYLVSPGFSKYLGEHASQRVDLNWGEPSWRPEAGRARLPLKGYEVLFVEPRPKYKARETVNVGIRASQQCL